MKHSLNLSFSHCHMIFSHLEKNDGVKRLLCGRPCKWTIQNRWQCYVGTCSWTDLESVYQRTSVGLENKHYPNNTQAVSAYMYNHVFKWQRNTGFVLSIYFAASSLRAVFKGWVNGFKPPPKFRDFQISNLQWSKHLRTLHINDQKMLPRYGFWQP